MRRSKEQRRTDYLDIGAALVAESAVPGGAEPGFATARVYAARHDKAKAVWSRSHMMLPPWIAPMKAAGPSSSPFSFGQRTNAS